MANVQSNLSAGTFDTDQYFESTLVIGNISSTFQFCYGDAHENIMDAFYWFESFGSIQNYFVAFIPNLMS